MKNFKLFDAELNLLNIIWENEPIKSTELSKICLEKLDWKKSTAFTMLKRLQERGVVSNKNAVVTSLVSAEQVKKYESEELVQKSFDGSLPAFLATFLNGKKLSRSEANELKKLIEEAQK